MFLTRSLSFFYNSKFSWLWLNWGTTGISTIFSPEWVSGFGCFFALDPLTGLFWDDNSENFLFFYLSDCALTLLLVPSFFGVSSFLSFSSWWLSGILHSRNKGFRNHFSYWTLPSLTGKGQSAERCKIVEMMWLWDVLSSADLFDVIHECSVE